MFINSDTNLASAPLLEHLATLAAKGAVRMHHIDSTYSLEEMPQAFARSETGHAVGKISIAVPKPTRADVERAVQSWAMGPEA